MYIKYFCFVLRAFKHVNLSVGVFFCHRYIFKPWLCAVQCAVLCKVTFSNASLFTICCSSEPQLVSTKAYWQYLSGMFFKSGIAYQIQKQWAFW